MNAVTASSLGRFERLPGNVALHGDVATGSGRQRPGPAPAATSPKARRQTGAAALIATLLLFLAMLLAAAFLNRHLVFEQRTSANQYRSTQAFEAAEAGLEWALARLNDLQPIGSDCRPSSDPGATSFRDRYLAYRPSDAGFAATTWSQAGVAAPLQPICSRSESGWECSCPASGPASVAAPTGSGPLPAFSVRFAAGPKAGLVRVVATGCTRLAAPCDAAAGASSDAAARIEVLLGLVPGLRTPPTAALTVRGDVDAGPAALGLHNPDPTTGIAVDAGGAFAAPAARVTPPAGGIAGAATVDHDAALAALTPDRLFAAHFGLPKRSWRDQPAVRRIACSGDCAAVLAAAIGDGSARPLIWVDGDLALAGPIVLGSTQRPVAIVVAGALRFSGAVQLHGIAYAESLAWNASPAPGGFARGALIGEGDYTGDAAADLVYDAGVLARLGGATGSFARVAGSWRDF